MPLLFSPFGTYRPLYISGHRPGISRYHTNLNHRRHSAAANGTVELVFEVDHSIEYGAHINEVINSLDIRHDEDESDES